MVRPPPRDNWEKLVRATLKMEQLRNAGQGYACRHPSGISGTVPPSLAQTTNLDLILQAADDIQSEDPNVARILCEQAYTMAQNLDPNSDGKGVLQFKSGLMNVVKQKLAKRAGGRIDRNRDIENLWEFYQRYKQQHRVDDIQREEQRLQESGTFSSTLGELKPRSSEMKKIISTLRALVDVMEALSKDADPSGVGGLITEELRKIKKSSATLSGEARPPPRDNWEKLVRATLKREQLRNAGQGHARHPSGIAGAVPPSIAQTTNLDLILQAADDIQSEDLNVARILCEQAYAMAQNLDPNSDGIGVLLFKTGLISVFQQKLAKRGGGRIDRNRDIENLWEFYQRYKQQHRVDDIQREEQRLLKPRSSEMKKIISTLRALVNVMEALSKDADPSGVGGLITEELRKIKKSSATLSGELTPDNIVPLEAPSLTNPIRIFPEDTCHTVPTPSLHSFPSGNIGYYFKSTIEASRKLIEALKDNNCYVLGLYGKRGSGKTTLLKAMIEEYEKIFHKVIFLHVSENQDNKSIRREFAKMLNVFEKHDTDAARIMKISWTLERKDKTTLVILDDFLTKSQPQELGIHYNSKQCKVLLTTRDEADCVLMRCDHSISLNPLSNDDVLTLLQKISGVNSQSALFEVAQKISFKCNGLPGLVVKVASSLKNMSIGKWEESLVSLSHSTARYQIFISFRGKDTREIFTNHLYEALCKEGFETFKDDETLEGGSPIDNLLEAIEESRFAIVVLSENFADSKWCLKELVKILDCRKRKKQLVLPIFYEVEPTDIRHLKGRYGEAIAEHEKELGKDSKTIMEWKQAFSDISNLKGEHFKAGIRDQFIGKIIRFANNNRHRLHIQSMYMN